MAQHRNGRGFAGLSPEAQREIASAGGRAAHESGHAHEWTSEEARSAGRLGGLAAHHHERAAFHHETAAHHHQRAAAHHAEGNRSRANLHAESAYAHEQRAGEHAEQAFRSSRARSDDPRDEGRRDDSRNENLDRVGPGPGSDVSFRGSARQGQESEDEIEPRRSRGGTNTDRGDDPDYSVNGRS